MRCLHTIACFALWLDPGVASAEGAPSELASANRLFAEGKQLSAAGRDVEACGKFEASMQLVPRLGAQLNIADCNERIGNLASAWVLWGRAVTLAQRMGDHREAYARQRQDDLALRLSRIIIALAPSTSNQVITVEVPELAQRPGLAGIAAPLQMGAPGASRGASPETSTEPADQRHLTPAGWIAAGIGAAGIGAGTVLGLSTRSLWKRARSGCDSSNTCSDAAFALAERSHLYGNLSTAAFIAAGAALATSGVLYLGSRRRARPAELVPAIGPGVVGIAVSGAL